METPRYTFHATEFVWCFSVGGYRRIVIADQTLFAFFLSKHNPKYLDNTGFIPNRGLGALAEQAFSSGMKMVTDPMRSNISSNIDKLMEQSLEEALAQDPRHYAIPFANISAISLLPVSWKNMENNIIIHLNDNSGYVTQKSKRKFVLDIPNDQARDEVFQQFQTLFPDKIK